MHKKDVKKVWQEVFGFRIGDRVRYTVYGRKTPFYGDIVDIDGTILHVEVEGDIVWCDVKEVTKVRRRKRRNPK